MKKRNKVVAMMMCAAMAVSTVTPTIPQVYAAESTQEAEISISDSVLSMTEKASKSFLVTDSSATKTSLPTVKSSDTKIATATVLNTGAEPVVKVSATGYGTCKITVTSADKKSTAECTVNVYCGDFTVDDLELLEGKSAVAIPKFANGYSYNVNNMNFSSSDKTVVTVDGNKLTAVKAGTATITAKILKENNDGATEDTVKTFKVTVVKPTPVSDITGVKESYSTYVGQGITLNPEVAPKDAYNKTLTFKSSDEKIAKVSDKGMITPVAPGKAVITIAATDGSKVEKKVDIRVLGQITKITAGEKEASVEAESKMEIPLTVDVKENENFLDMLTVTSKDEKVATAEIKEYKPESEKDKANAMLVVTGVAAGASEITVSSKNPTEDDVTATVKITVTEKKVEEKPEDKKPEDTKPVDTQKKTDPTKTTEQPKTKAPQITTVTVKGITYTLVGEIAEITSGNDASGNVVIPATVTIGDKIAKVTAINSGAFKGNKKIKKVTIGTNIRTIGRKAFSGCSKLKTVTIKSKVLTMAKGAFKKSVTIKVPKSKKKAYKKLFKGYIVK
ncbi:MAG: leucine-rich repeat protein [Lachnospiraceae bacterium]|nr:leucine-rich repeat protein [Lachnospiraceae bacterium]